MSTIAEITAAYSRGLDRARAVLFNSASLVLAKTVAGAQDVILGEVLSGWLPDEQHVRGSIETILTISVAESALFLENGSLIAAIPMPAATMNTVNRAIVNGKKYEIQPIDQPEFPPRAWTLYAQEQIQGAIE